jgi:hypothetical protein
LPEDWEERVTEPATPAEQKEDLERQERGLKATIEHATRLDQKEQIRYELLAKTITVPRPA